MLRFVPAWAQRMSIRAMGWLLCLCPTAYTDRQTGCAWANACSSANMRRLVELIERGQKEKAAAVAEARKKQAELRGCDARRGSEVQFDLEGGTTVGSKNKHKLSTWNLKVRMAGLLQAGWCTRSPCVCASSHAAPVGVSCTRSPA